MNCVDLKVEKSIGVTVVDIVLLLWKVSLLWLQCWQLDSSYAMVKRPRIKIISFFVSLKLT